MTNPFDEFDQPQQSANPFDEFDSTTPQQAQTIISGLENTQIGSQGAGIATTSTSPKWDAFMAGVTNFNRVFGNLAEGGLGIVGNTIEKLTGSSTLKEAVKTVHENEEYAANIARSAYPKASLAGTLTGAVASAALPGGAMRGMPLAGQVVTGAATGLGYGFLNYEENLSDRLKNAAVGSLFGALTPVALKGYSSAGKQLLSKTDDLQPAGMLQKIVSPEKAALKNMAYEIDSSPEGRTLLQQRSKLFKEEGVPASFADLAGETQINKEILKTVNTPQLNKTLKEFNFNRNQILQQKINDMVDNFVPGGYEQNYKAMKEAYKVVDSVQLPLHTKEGQELLSDPIILQMLDDVNNSKILKMNSLPDTALAKYDQIKKMLDKTLFTSTNLKSNTKLDPGEWNALNQTRANLINSLDAMSPEYAQARQLADRVYYYNQYKNLGSKYKKGTGEQLSLGQQYDELFSTAEKQADLLQAVKRTGGNVESIQRLSQILNITKDNAIEMLSNKAYDTKGMPGSLRRFGEYISRWLGSNRYYNNFVKLALSGEKTQQAVISLIDRYTKNPNQNNIKSILEYIKNYTPEIIKSSVSKIPSRTGLLSQE